MGILLTGLALAPTSVVAAPQTYRLDPGATKVGFGFDLNGIAQTGEMPVTRSRILLDPARLEAASVDVTLDVSKARTGLFLATQAMLGSEVLDAARFPTIRFRSTRVRLARDGRLSDGARLFGDLTLRGITRPIALQADIYRPQGSAPDDLSTLTIHLRGALSRADFGAAGYPDLVADTVRLEIAATIHAD